MPAPALPSQVFSDDFGNLISMCLEKNPQLRPSAHDLLKHPWLRQAGNKDKRNDDGLRYDRTEEDLLSRSRSNKSRDMSEMLGVMQLREE